MGDWTVETWSRVRHGRVRAIEVVRGGGIAGGDVIVVEEEKIPVREPVRAYAEMLGVDPLTLASEGVAVLAVDPSKAEEIVERMRELGYRDASIIGEVRSSERHRGIVLLRSVTGGVRILEPPSGEIVPRIC
jgi:hydrogenase expression/formation protein HypE